MIGVKKNLSIRSKTAFAKGGFFNSLTYYFVYYYMVVTIFSDF